MAARDESMAMIQHSGFYVRENVGLYQNTVKAKTKTQRGLPKHCSFRLMNLVLLSCMHFEILLKTNKARNPFRRKMSTA